MEYHLTLPATDRAFSDTGLFRWHTFGVGMALVREGSSWSLMETVTDADLAGAAQYFQGGRDHVVDQETRDSLVAAGYGAYLTEA